MKILTKKEQKALFDNLMTLYLDGSDAVHAMALQPGGALYGMQVQKRMIDMMMQSAQILHGKYGMQLAMNIQSQLNTMRKNGEVKEPWQPQESMADKKK